MTPQGLYDDIMSSLPPDFETKANKLLKDFMLQSCKDALSQPYENKDVLYTRFLIIFTESKKSIDDIIAATKDFLST